MGDEASFVSILARPEGRALLAEMVADLEVYPVSILARPEGRALPQRSQQSTTEYEFQSSPAPKDGRYRQACALRHQEIERRTMQVGTLREALQIGFNRQLFERPPCYICGYNGQLYYQPGMHPCAQFYHQHALKEVTT